MKLFFTLLLIILLSIDVFADETKNGWFLKVGPQNSDSTNLN